jgi:hypothetical protein
MQQQTRNFSLVIAESSAQPSYLIHDRDGAFRTLDEGIAFCRNQGHLGPAAFTDVQCVC